MYISAINRYQATFTLYIFQKVVFTWCFNSKTQICKLVLWFDTKPFVVFTYTQISNTFFSELIRLQIMGTSIGQLDSRQVSTVRLVQFFQRFPQCGHGISVVKYHEEETIQMIALWKKRQCFQITQEITKRGCRYWNVKSIKCSNWHYS